MRGGWGSREGLENMYGVCDYPSSPSQNNAVEKNIQQKMAHLWPPGEFWRSCLEEKHIFISLIQEWSTSPKNRIDDFEREIFFVGKYSISHTGMFTEKKAFLKVFCH